MAPRIRYLVAALAAMFAAMHGANAGASDPIDAIDAYTGSWHSHIAYQGTKYSKARVADDDVRNDCWRSDDYYACHQFVNGASAALIVYTYDPKLALYHSHVIQQGSVPDGAGTLVIAGNRWTYPWKDEDNGTPVYFRIVNTFQDANTIDFSEAYSLDQIHWTQIAAGKEHRASQ